ncbi:MAG: DUF4167 domain-containing protein [Holosporaceae bacterium]
MKINSSRRHGQSNRGNRFPSKDSTIESVGPAGKVRGNLQHLVDRYMALGKEALGGRDFAEAESFFQHAEHYRRLLAQHKATKAPPKNTPSDDSGAGKTGEKDAVSLKEAPTTQKTGEPAAAAEELPSFLVTSEAPKETAKEAPPKPVEEKPKTLKRTSVAARKTPSQTTTSTRTASPKAEE